MLHDELSDVGFVWEDATDALVGDWEYLDVPGNRVWYPAEDGAAELPVPATNGASFRLRLYEL